MVVGIANKYIRNLLGEAFLFGEDWDETVEGHTKPE
jgi:hypothetical protein